MTINGLWEASGNAMALYALQAQQNAMQYGGLCPRQETKPLPQETVYGELRGWRAWSLINTPEGWRLKSTYAGVIWPGGIVGGENCQQNSAQTHTCGSSGFYAFKSKDHLFAQLSDEHIYGEVELWGSVVEHDRGYRAECMRILSLLPVSKKRLDELWRKDRGWINWPFTFSARGNEHIAADLFNNYLEDSNGHRRADQETNGGSDSQPYPRISARGTDKSADKGTRTGTGES